MPVSVVVGGQFGSEGKGKVALELVRRSKEQTIAVRVGGPNSGHTAYDRKGVRWALRQLPAACVDRNVPVVIGPGSYIDVELLRLEIEALDFPRDLVHISPYARVINHQHKAWEAQADLIAAIGSTGSGVGAAVMASVARESVNFPLRSVSADEDPWLASYVVDTTEFLRRNLDAGARVVVEGTQGFGLSLLQGGYWPKVTSRETTAAAAVSEAGLSPLDVDDVLLVIRTFPIRVAGESGPLKGELSWPEIAGRAGLDGDLREYTTATKKIRRVGDFDPELVRRAIAANQPTRIVLNHLDYIDSASDHFSHSKKVYDFVKEVEELLGRRIDMLGFSPIETVDASVVV